MFKTLKAKVITSFILFVMFPAFVSSGIILFNIMVTQRKTVDMLQTTMSKRVASEFENYITYNVAQVKQSIEFEELPLENPEKLKDKLMTQIMFSNNFDQFIVLNAEGHEIVNVHRYKLAAQDGFKSYAADIEYLFPKFNRNIFFGKVTFSEDTGEPLSKISFHIVNPRDNSLKGVIIASLRLKPIWNLLANIHTEKGQQIYILDSESRLIAHPNPSMVLKNTIFKLPQQKIATGLTGQNSYIKYVRLNFGNQFFTVVSEQKLKNAFELFRNTSIVVFIVISISIVFGALLIFFHIKLIVNPIKHLARVAKDIEGGNLEQKAKVFYDDEIGAMARAFNNMTDTLKDNNVKLKEFNIGLQNKIQEEIKKTRKMEQMLFEQKKFADMGEMINAIAHQWRQPLNNIGILQQLMFEMVKRDDIDKKEFNEYSENLMDLVQRMSGTIDDFRKFFTTDKVRETFNVVDAVKDFMSLICAQLSNSNISYSIRCHCCENKHIFDSSMQESGCDNHDLDISGYSGEFKQVVQNIVANARDAFITNKTEDPHIEVVVHLQNNTIEISFRDNAGGIPEEVLPNIFDPYFTTKDEGKGTGIGLYMSKVIIDDHFEGRLTARNVPGGAELIIKIPKTRSKE